MRALSGRPLRSSRMAKYVDGFVIALPKRSLAAYRRMSKLGCAVWMEHGALEYRECLGEDLANPMGTPFPRMAKTKRGETVVFSWIVYRSRKHRDQVNKKVMADPRIRDMMVGQP